LRRRSKNRLHTRASLIKGRCRATARRRDSTPIASLVKWRGTGFAGGGIPAQIKKILKKKEL